MNETQWRYETGRARVPLFRLAQAEEALEDARILLGRARLQGAVNRLYYACFYAVTALLFSERHAAARHKSLLLLFDRHWVGTARVPREMGRFFHRIFERRQRGDYGEKAAFQRGDVAAWLAETETFVARISNEIDRTLRKG
ncbi:MAG TPA: HEPN domain-containing protein [Candidatus Hydrogenedentes bacterium]|nr:HEPN domain-containing protein [Candidatus Hydrogenedentota bacterium]HIJ74056.1 HEPN domain-containing protein [Candidatus Hydrogenedentota bacterium]